MVNKIGPDVWKQYVVNLECKATVNDMQTVVCSLFQTVSDGNVDKIDFAFLSPEITNGELLTAALRATFSWRSQIPSWKYGVEVAHEALTNQGHDPDQVLVGLK